MTEWGEWSAPLARGFYAAPSASVLLVFALVFLLAYACALYARRRSSATQTSQTKHARPTETARTSDGADAATVARTLREGLAPTRRALLAKFTALTGRNVDAALFEELETLLLEADLGGGTVDALLAQLRVHARTQKLTTLEALRAHLQNAIAEKLRAIEPALESFEPQADAPAPHVVLVLGVNGAGKTTTVGKLAARYRRAGHKVVLAAADTFRAAAREQLQIWGARHGCEVVTGAAGADPAAVAFDAVQTARANGATRVLVDTAGRLQTNAPLLDELKKIARVLGRAQPGAPHETLLVLDANTGQNALSQAREFTAALPVTALALTKLDGSARGGVLVSLADAFGIPVKYIGVGERAEDLRPFNAQEFATALWPDTHEDAPPPPRP